MDRQAIGVGHLLKNLNEPRQDSPEGGGVDKQHGLPRPDNRPPGGPHGSGDKKYHHHENRDEKIPVKGNQCFFLGTLGKLGVEADGGSHVQERRDLTEKVR